jgi:predicted porin
VYGVLDGSYTATENKSNTTAAAATTTVKGRNTVNGDGALSTSRIGFRGVEDMGGGTKAQFVLEYDLVNFGNGATGSDLTVGTNTNAGSVATTGANQGFGARQSWLGLGNDKLGELRVGRQFQSV